MIILQLLLVDLDSFFYLTTKRVLKIHKASHLGLPFYINNNNMQFKLHYKILIKNYKMLKINTNI